MYASTYLSFDVSTGSPYDCQCDSCFYILVSWPGTAELVFNSSGTSKYGLDIIIYHHPGVEHGVVVCGHSLHAHKL